jgi:CRISPR-associated protein Cmr5
MTNEMKPTEGEISVKKLMVKAPASSQLPTSELAPLRTRSQVYAAAVYEKVMAIKDDTTKKKKFQKKYGGMAHKLPVLIRTAGLAQALAFIEVKGTDEAGWKRLLEDLNTVVGPTNGKGLLKASLEEDLVSYMHLTRKTTNALVWFKRFAVSLLNVRQGEEDSSFGDDQTDEDLIAKASPANAEQGTEP